MSPQAGNREPGVPGTTAGAAVTLPRGNRKRRHLYRHALLLRFGYPLLSLAGTAAFIAWHCWINRLTYLEDFRANARDRVEQIEALHLVDLTRQRDVAGLFATSPAVDADEFRTFVNQTLGYGSSHVSMALILPTTRAERPAFERGLRRDYGLAHARLRSPAKAEAAKAQTSFWAIRYAEPIDSELSLPGLDLSGEPGIPAAVARALATGETTFVEIAPTHASSDARAFRLLTPIHAARRDPRPFNPAAGVICGTYRYRGLLETVFSRTSRLGQHVYAYASDSPTALPVYGHGSRTGGEVAFEPRLPRAGLVRYPGYIEERVHLADHPLTLAFVPVRPMDLIAYVDHRARVVALAGILISALLGLFGHRIATGRAQRQAAEERLRLAATVFHDAQEAILITDASGHIVDVNGTFTHITGYPRDEVLRRKPSLMKSGVHDAAFYRDFWHNLVKDGVWRGEFWNRHRNGQLIAVQATVSAVRDDSGQISHFIDLFSDITDRKTQQERIEHLAYFDALTDLPNRTLLSDRLDRALSRARRDGSTVSVAYLDLDDFKPVNDTHGHKAGDLLLCEIARRLKASVREHDTVCRLGGDEFVLILAGLRSWDECERILTRSLESIAQPFLLPNGAAVRVTGSIGVTLSPPDRGSADGLLRHADQAMYAAKRSGPSRIERFAGPDPREGQGELRPV